MMKKHTVKIQNRTFTVYDNAADAEPEVNGESLYDVEYDTGWSGDCLYNPGDKIIEIFVGLRKDTVFFGGYDDEGRVLLFTDNDAITCPANMDVNRQTAGEAYSEHYRLDIFKITRANKSFFYEAASDMNEKADLYKQLGAKIEVAYRYKRGSQKDKQTL